MPDEEETPPEGGNDDGHSDDAGDAGAGDETPILERLEAILPNLEGLFAEHDDDAGAAPVTTSTDHSIRDQVRAALAEVGEEKALKERVDHIEQVVEKPPMKQSRLSRAIWGKVEA